MFNEIAKRIHKDSVDRGFYDKPVEFGTSLMLITSELAEALEADRKGIRADEGAFVAGCAPNDMESFKENFKKYIKDSVEDEIADAFIRLFDLAGYMGINLDFHIGQKLEYNRTRGYKHGKNY